MENKSKKKEDKKKNLLFITVIGKDQKGIVAKISNILYKTNINIEDINQKIMDKYFVMIMLIDMKNAGIKIEILDDKLKKIAREMHLIIQLQHENIFKMMHRI